MTVVEHTFSDFLRKPKPVVDDLVEGDVLLRRRGASPLRLSPWDRDVATSEALVAVVRLLRHLAVHSSEALRAAAGEAFPWSDLLPAEDRDAFLEELTRVLAGSAEVGAFGPVVRMLAEWRATAAVHADPSRARRLSTPLPGTGDRVPAPPA